MPCRELPKTDTTREDALRAIYSKAVAPPAEGLPFTDANSAHIKTFYPLFQKEISERGTALSVQSEATKLTIAAEATCRMYVSHFYQVFNLGIDRDKYKASDRAFYQLDISQESVPDLTTQDNLCRNAEHIITGDAVRTAAGGAAMVNPSKDEVEVVYNDYLSKLSSQSTKKEAYAKEQKDVDDIRAEADELILDVWDEVEFNFRKLGQTSMRRKAREYGVVYVSRPGEPPEDAAPVQEQTQAPAK